MTTLFEKSMVPKTLTLFGGGVVVWVRVGVRVRVRVKVRVRVRFRVRVRVKVLFATI